MEVWALRLLLLQLSSIHNRLRNQRADWQRLSRAVILFSSSAVSIGLSSDGCDYFQSITVNNEETKPELLLRWPRNAAEVQLSFSSEWGGLLFNLLFLSSLSENMTRNHTVSNTTGWLKKSKLLYCDNSLLFLSHPVDSLNYIL